jgi:hypothetical protein
LVLGFGNWKVDFVVNSFFSNLKSCIVWIITGHCHFQDVYKE